MVILVCRNIEKDREQEKHRKRQTYSPAHLRRLPDVNAKRTLIRLCEPQRDPRGPNRKMNGRGAYLHNLRSCWERG
jgi:hypothetical protein